MRLENDFIASGYANGATVIANAFRERVLADAGTFEHFNFLTDWILRNQFILDNASLILTPNAYKTSKVYCLKPFDGSADFTFTRNSGANRILQNGERQLVSNHIARLNFASNRPSWLFEPQITNLILNSDLPSTQNISVTTGLAYILSFYGSGNVTVSGVGSLNLTGVNNNTRVFALFTPSSAGSVTLTITGDVFFAQLERASTENTFLPTSYISTNVTTTITRTRDLMTRLNIQSLIGQTSGSVYFELDKLDRGSAIRIFGANLNNSVVQVFIPNALRAEYIIRYNSALRNSNADPSAPNNTRKSKVVMIYSETFIKVFINGQLFWNLEFLIQAFQEVLTRIELGSLSEGGSGNLYAFALFTTALTDLQASLITI